jgi:hypothetical protein
VSNRNQHFLLRFALLLAFASTALALPGTTSAQASPPGANSREFSGTWHWLYHGQPFATMVLASKGDGFAGSVTNASIDSDADGKLTNAVALSGNSPIIRSSLKDGILRIVCKADDDEIEWAVKLTSPTTAEVEPAGTEAPKMEAIHAEKVP